MINKTRICIYLIFSLGLVVYVGKNKVRSDSDSFQDFRLRRKPIGKFFLVDASKVVKILSITNIPEGRQIKLQTITGVVIYIICDYQSKTWKFTVEHQDKENPNLKSRVHYKDDLSTAPGKKTHACLVIKTADFSAHIFLPKNLIFKLESIKIKKNGTCKVEQKWQILDKTIKGAVNKVIAQSSQESVLAIDSKNFVPFKHYIDPARLFAMNIYAETYRQINLYQNYILTGTYIGVLIGVEKEKENIIIDKSKGEIIIISAPIACNCPQKNVIC